MGWFCCCYCFEAAAAPFALPPLYYYYSFIGALETTLTPDFPALILTAAGFPAAPLVTDLTCAVAVTLEVLFCFGITI